jgi:general stress protein 26
MEVHQFEDLQEEFMRRVSQAVYCAMATIDLKNRPRSRVLHPVWDGPIGWVITSPGSHKAKHLVRHPAVSLAYIHDPLKPVFVDCIAAWVADTSEKQRIWELHKSLPPPLGFDPEPHYGNIDHPHYGLLRFTPWRMELGDLYGEPVVWRSGMSLSEGLR